MAPMAPCQVQDIDQWLWCYAWSELVMHLYMDKTGPCLTTAIWRCRKNSTRWQRSFQWKLRSHWLKFLRQRHVAVVRQGQGLHTSGVRFTCIKQSPLTWGVRGFHTASCQWGLILFPTSASEETRGHIRDEWYNRTIFHISWGTFLDTEKYKRVMLFWSHFNNDFLSHFRYDKQISLTVMQFLPSDYYKPLDKKCQLLSNVTSKTL